MGVDQEREDWIARDASRGRMVDRVSRALMEAWFPNPNGQPVGEDLENWLDIARSDAYVAVRSLMEGAWLDDPTMD